jgi:hypothetical protein
VSWLARAAYLTALLVSSGCPAETKSPSPEAAANAQRTLDALRRQAQSRFDDLRKLPSEGETRVADETKAVKGLKIWLTQRRQWRSEPYRIRLAPPEGKALDKAGLEALIAAGEPVTLVLSVPELDPAPSGTREFQDPKALAPLVDLLSAGS